MTASLGFVLSVTAALAAAQRNEPPSAPAARIVSEAVGEAVTAADVQDALVARRQSGDPQQILATLTPEGVEEVARTVLLRKLMARQARALGLDADAAVARALDRAVDEVLIDALVADTMAALDRSDAALRRYYDTHPEEFSGGERRKAHHIVVATEAEAAQVLADLAAGQAFDAIAAERNIDNTRARRGDLGWVERGVMVAPFDAGLFALTTPGATSPVVQTSFGYHVIRVDDVDHGTRHPFELVREQVAQVMAARAVASLHTAILERHAAIVHHEALATLLSDGGRH